MRRLKNMKNEKAIISNVYLFVSHAEKIGEITDFLLFLIEKFVRLLYTCPVMMKVWIRFFESFP